MWIKIIAFIVIGIIIASYLHNEAIKAEEEKTTRQNRKPWEEELPPKEESCISIGIIIVLILIEMYIGFQIVGLVFRILGRIFTTLGNSVL